MAISCVYKISSPTGRVYIGQTNSLSRRIVEHNYMSKNSTLKLSNSIRKYGISKHIIEPIFISECEYEKDMMEAFYISYYDSVKKGMNNLNLPGVRHAFKGKKHTKENILKIKNRMSGFTPIKAIEKRMKSVYCLDNNMTFNSLSECARHFNVSQAYISSMLNGSRNNKLNIKLL